MEQSIIDHICKDSLKRGALYLLGWSEVNECG